MNVAIWASAISALLTSVASMPRSFHCFAVFRCGHAFNVSCGTPSPARRSRAQPSVVVPEGLRPSGVLPRPLPYLFRYAPPLFLGRLFGGVGL